MTQGKSSRMQKRLSPAIVVTVIALAVVAAILIGLYGIAPKRKPLPEKFVPMVPPEVVRERVQRMKVWKKEMADAEREGRKPDPSLMPIPPGGSLAGGRSRLPIEPAPQ